MTDELVVGHIGEEEEDEVAVTPDPNPFDAMGVLEKGQYLDNWLDRYRDLMAQESESPAIFWEAAGMTCINAAIGRNAMVLNPKIGRRLPYHINQYMMIIGPAHYVHKSSVIKKGVSYYTQGIPRLHEYVDMSFTVPAFQGEIQNNPMAGPLNPYDDTRQQTNVLLVTSEMERVSRGGGDHGNIFDLLRHAYDADQESMSHMTRAGNEVVKWLNLNFLGGTTPEHMERRFNRELVGDGLESRFTFVIFDPVRDARTTQAWGPREMSTDSIEMMHRLAYELSTFAYYPKDHVLTPDAWVMKEYEGFYDDYSALMDPDLARLDLRIMKTAMTYALSERSDIITKDHYIRAQEFITDLTSRWVSHRNVMLMSDDQKATRKVIQFLQERRSAVPEDGWVSISMIFTRLVMPIIGKTYAANNVITSMRKKAPIGVEINKDGTEMWRAFVPGDDPDERGSSFEG